MNMNTNINNLSQDSVIDHSIIDWAAANEHNKRMGHNNNDGGVVTSGNLNYYVLERVNPTPVPSATSSAVDTSPPSTDGIRSRVTWESDHNSSTCPIDQFEIRDFFTFEVPILDIQLSLIDIGNTCSLIYTLLISILLAYNVYNYICNKISIIYIFIKIIYTKSRLFMKLYYIHQFKYLSIYYCLFIMEILPIILIGFTSPFT